MEAPDIKDHDIRLWIDDKIKALKYETGLDILVLIREELEKPEPFKKGYR